ncbi:hypothetical protein MTO96_011333 [Rhipicephalus appendiculatus]
MVTALDYSVGQIMSSLDEAGILNNTFIVFVSDNGAGTTFWGANAASSWPLRGEKDTLFEGGVRVPGIMWAPEPWRQRMGSEYMELFHATDWLPTLYELAGGNLGNISRMDGVSHLKSLKDPTVGAPRTEVLLNIDPTDGNAALISNKYKLVNGSFPRASSDWLRTPGDREKPDVESLRARDACRNSPTFKVIDKLVASREELRKINAELEDVIPVEELETEYESEAHDDDQTLETLTRLRCRLEDLSIGLCPVQRLGAGFSRRRVVAALSFRTRVRAKGEDDGRGKLEGFVVVSPAWGG